MRKLRRLFFPEVRISFWPLHSPRVRFSIMKTVLLVTLALKICSTRTEGMKVEMTLREKGQSRVSGVDI